VLLQPSDCNGSRGVDFDEKKMSSSVEASTRKKATGKYGVSKFGWLPPPAANYYSCPAAEMLLCRPRSCTPTTHERIIRDSHHHHHHRRHRADEAGVYGGRGENGHAAYQSVHHPITSSVLPSRQSVACTNHRPISSDHHKSDQSHVCMHIDRSINRTF